MASIRYPKFIPLGDDKAGGQSFKIEMSECKYFTFSLKVGAHVSETELGNRLFNFARSITNAVRQLSDQSELNKSDPRLVFETAKIIDVELDESAVTLRGQCQQLSFYLVSQAAIYGHQEAREFIEAFEEAQIKDTNEGFREEKGKDKEKEKKREVSEGPPSEPKALAPIKKPKMPQVMAQADFKFFEPFMLTGLTSLNAEAIEKIKLRVNLFYQSLLELARQNPENLNAKFLEKIALEFKFGEGNIYIQLSAKMIEAMDEIKEEANGRRDPIDMYTGGMSDKPSPRFIFLNMLTNILIANSLPESLRDKKVEKVSSIPPKLFASVCMNTGNLQLISAGIPATSKSMTTYTEQIYLEGVEISPTSLSRSLLFLHLIIDQNFISWVKSRILQRRASAAVYSKDPVNLVYLLKWLLIGDIHHSELYPIPKELQNCVPLLKDIFKKYGHLNTWDQTTLSEIFELLYKRAVNAKPIFEIIELIICTLKSLGKEDLLISILKPQYLPLLELQRECGRLPKSESCITAEREVRLRDIRGDAKATALVSSAKTSALMFYEEIRKLIYTHAHDSQDFAESGKHIRFEYQYKITSEGGGVCCFSYVNPTFVRARIASEFKICGNNDVKKVDIENLYKSLEKAIPSIFSIEIAGKQPLTKIPDEKSFNLSDPRHVLLNKFISLYVLMQLTALFPIRLYPHYKYHHELKSDQTDRNPAFTVSATTGTIVELRRTGKDRDQDDSRNVTMIMTNPQVVIADLQLIYSPNNLIKTLRDHKVVSELSNEEIQIVVNILVAGTNIRTSERGYLWELFNEFFVTINGKSIIEWTLDDFIKAHQYLSSKLADKSPDTLNNILCIILYLLGNFSNRNTVLSSNIPNENLRQLVAAGFFSFSVRDREFKKQEELQLPVAHTLFAPIAPQKGGEIVLKLAEVNFPLEQLIFEKNIGRGGYGVVKQVYIENMVRASLYPSPEKTRTYYAVKEMDCKMMHIATKEIGLLIKLRHNCIVPLHGFAIKEDKIYLVMECMDRSLHDELKMQQSGLTKADVWAIVFDILDGLKYLHDNMIYHFDLKSRNILLKEKRAAIADFGLAKLKGGEKGHRGTKGWADPKAAEHEHGDKSDCYSLGVLFAEFLPLLIKLYGKTPKFPYSESVIIQGKDDKGVIDPFKIFPELYSVQDLLPFCQLINALTRADVSARASVTEAIDLVVEYRTENPLKASQALTK